VDTDKIRFLYDGGMRQKDISDMYECSRSAVQQFMARKGMKARPQPRFQKGYIPTAKQLAVVQGIYAYRFKKGDKTRLGKGVKQVALVCDSCNKEFKRYQYEPLPRHSFCSTDCRNQFQKENGRLYTTIPKPNQGELALLSILKSMDNKWKFVGNGSLWIGGKNPDFCDGGNGLVELYGGGWHTKEEGEQRIAHFRSNGYECLIVWHSELRKREILKERIIEWVQQVYAFV
jgi:hypothetical protein